MSRSNHMYHEDGDITFGDDIPESVTLSPAEAKLFAEYPDHEDQIKSDYIGEIQNPVCRRCPNVLHCTLLNPEHTDCIPF